MDRRVSLITGGASGIGLAIARMLRDAGPVYVADIDESALSAVEAEGLRPIRLDVADTAAWRGLASRLAAEEGRLDHLVHGAGVAPIAHLTDASDELIDRTYATNVRSVLVGTRELWDLLTASRGSVVSIASVAGVVGQAASAAYVASKGAVISVTRALAIELAPAGVRVNCVSPGTTLTPLLRAHFASLPDGDRAQAQITRRQPLGRLLTPEDIAPTVVHLLSPATAAGITGANYIVDGGLTASFDYGNDFAGGGSR